MSGLTVTVMGREIDRAQELRREHHPEELPG